MSVDWQALLKAMGGVRMMAVYVVVFVLAVSVLYADRTGAISDTVRSWGSPGIIVAMLIMCIVCLTPVPSEGLLVVYMKVYGGLWGVFYSWTGAVVSAAIVFPVARRYGQQALRRFMTEGTFREIDAWVRDKGTFGLLVARLLPLPGFVVSYAAGIMPAIHPWPYLWTAAVSLIPYYVGVSLMYVGIAHGTVWILVIGGLALAVVWAVGLLVHRMKRRSAVMDDRTVTRSEGGNMDAADGNTGGTEDAMNGGYRSQPADSARAEGGPDSLFGRLWMKWEALFQKMSRLKTLADDREYMFFITRHPYMGHAFEVDGVQVKLFDPVIEIHMNNELLTKILGEEDNMVRVAVRLISEAKRSFPALADAVNTPEYEREKAVYGMTFIHRYIERYGMTTFPMKWRWAEKLFAQYLRLVFRAVNPRGAEMMRMNRDHFVPRMIAISTEHLIEKWGTKGTPSTDGKTAMTTQGAASDGAGTEDGGE